MYKRRAQTQYLLKDIAKRINAPIIGNPDLEITGLSASEQPRANTICFTRVLSEHFSVIDSCCIIIPKNTSETLMARHQGTNQKISFLICEDPQASFIECLSLFYEPYLPFKGIHAHAVISSSAQIGKNVTIGPFTVIGENCTIGDNCFIGSHVALYPNVSIGNNSSIHAHVSIREDSKIGNYCILHAGVAIGTDGFGYIPDKKIGIQKVPQVGNVTIGDFVEIGANSCIDRGAIDSTQIAQGCKLDNLVQVGHNTKIGAFSILCGQVGIAGSSHIGSQVTIGGQSGVAGHLKIADKVRIAGNSGVIGNITETGDYAGFPAIPAHLWRRASVAFKKLPSLLRAQAKANIDDKSSV